MDRAQAARTGHALALPGQLRTSQVTVTAKATPEPAATRAAVHDINPPGARKRATKRPLEQQKDDNQAHRAQCGRSCHRDGALPSRQSAPFELLES